MVCGTPGAPTAVTAALGLPPVRVKGSRCGANPRAHRGIRLRGTTTVQLPTPLSFQAPTMEEATTDIALDTDTQVRPSVRLVLAVAALSVAAFSALPALSALSAHRALGSLTF